MIIVKKVKFCDGYVKTFENVASTHLGDLNKENTISVNVNLAMISTQIFNSDFSAQKH
jgi:hypothetical protein